METLNDFFSSSAFTTSFVDQFENSADAFSNSAADDDDETADEGADEEYEPEQTTDAGNDNPAIDEEVVHSPVPTQSGGKPKRQ